MTCLCKKRHTFGTNSMSVRNSSATALRAVAGDSPQTGPEETRRFRTRPLRCPT
jgi:hypothetical protein